jgi:hypothetical protein
MIWREGNSDKLLTEIDVIFSGFPGKTVMWPARTALSETPSK